jgi:hypothetical protein
VSLSYGTRSIRLDAGVRISEPTSGIKCLFDPTAGTGTVPASLLALMPQGTGSLLAQSTVTTDATDGAFAVSLYVSYQIVIYPVQYQ